MHVFFLFHLYTLEVLLYKYKFLTFQFQANAFWLSGLRRELARGTVLWPGVHRMSSPKSYSTIQECRWQNAPVLVRHPKLKSYKKVATPLLAGFLLTWIVSLSKEFSSEKQLVEVRGSPSSLLQKGATIFVQHFFLVLFKNMYDIILDL